MFSFFFLGINSNPPFVSIEVILNGLESKELSEDYKEKIENTVQYDTFMRKPGLKNYSSCSCSCCCSCFKPVCGVCRKKVKPNMYQILGLDMKQEFEKNIEQQNKNIKQAFENSMKKYDPAENEEHGNRLIVGKIQEAREELENPEKRVKYVNKYEHESPCCFWSYYACCHCGCSCDSLRSAFYPLQTPQENLARDSDKISRETQCCRILMLIFSVLCCIAGTILTIFVIGPGVSTTPQGIYSGAAFGGVLTGAGFLGGFRNLSEEGFKLIDLVISSFLGGFFGGISEVISCVVFEEFHLTNWSPVVEEMIVGIITGATGSSLSWVANVSEDFCFSRETLTGKSLFIYFLCSLVVGVFVGGIIGCIGGAVKREITQNTSIDEFTIVSLVQKFILKNQRKGLRVALKGIDGAVGKLAKGKQSPNVLSSDSVQSIDKCC